MINSILTMVTAVSLTFTPIAPTETVICEVQPQTIDNGIVTEFMTEQGSVYCKDVFAPKVRAWQYDTIVVNKKDAKAPLQAGQLLDVTIDMKTGDKTIELLKTKSKQQVK